MVIHEIISDEEVDFGDTRKHVGYGVGGGGFCDRDDCDWLSEILDEVGGNKVDNSDDLLNPAKKPKLEPSKPSDKVEGDDDDDDCVILDGDPNKPAPGVNFKVDVVDDDDEDDVKIVGENGEVACRDFPHARHLCAKFLFASTPHETCCSQCHCYICDSLAPCPHWGTGTSSIDHCHATDKHEYWLAERRRMRKDNNPAPAVPHIKNIPLLRPAFRQPTQQPVQTHPAAPHFSATSSGVGGPNASNQGRAHPVPVYRPRPQSVPLHSRRHGSVGASTSNIRPRGPHLSRNDPMADIKRLLAQRRGGPRHVTHHRDSRHSHSARQINSAHGVHVANYVPSQNRVHSSPYSTVIAGPAHRPPSQPYVNFNNNFVTVASRPSVDNLILPPYAGNVFGSGLNSRFTIPSNQNAGINSADQFSQPRAHVNPSSVPFGIPIGSQQGNHNARNAVDSSPDNFVSTGEGSRCRSAGPTINLQLHSVNENDSCQSKASLADISSSLANDVGCQFSESTPHGTFDFEDYNWMFESRSLPVSPLWSSLSPEDTGNLFDV